VPTSSVSGVEKKLSATALSQQSPRRLMLATMPCRASARRYDSDAYVEPRSEWCNSPGVEATASDAEYAAQHETA
jgi:hypothetical protein